MQSPIPCLLLSALALPSHAVASSSWRSLLAVRRRGVNLGLWLRGAAAEVRDALDAGAVESIRVHADVDATAAAAVAETLWEGIGSNVAARTFLVEDTLDLLQLFTRVTGHARARLKLETVGSDECRQFHCDQMGLRLVCTYVGPGTDWVDNGACRREHLGGRGLERRSASHVVNEAIVADWRRVYRLPRFAAAIFRGEKRATRHTPALVHRSPPIEGTGLHRLRLVIDESPNDEKT